MTVDLYAVQGFQSIRYLAIRDPAKKLAPLAGLGFYFDRLRFDARCEFFGFCEQLFVALGRGGLAAGYLRQIAGSGFLCDSARQQVIARVAFCDLGDGAGLANPFEILPQNDFHAYSALKGRSAMTRARFTASVSAR